MSSLKPGDRIGPHASAFEEIDALKRRQTPGQPALPMRAAVPGQERPQQVTFSGWTAFKFGFYAFWGFLLAGIVPWLILIFIVLSLGILGTRH